MFLRCLQSHANVFKVFLQSHAQCFRVFTEPCQLFSRVFTETCQLFSRVFTEYQMDVSELGITEDDSKARFWRGIVGRSCCGSRAYNNYSDPVHFLRSDTDSFYN